MNNSLEEIMVFLIYSFIFIVVLFCFVFSVSQILKFYFKAKASLKWPFVKGKIIKSELVGRIDSVDFVLQYEYMINGERFISSRMYFGTLDFLDKSVLKKYRVGKEVEVYYNPSNNEESVLETGISTNLQLLPIISVVLFLFLLLFCYLSITKLQSLLAVA